MDKKLLRKHFTDLRNSLSQNELNLLSNKVENNLFSSEIYKNANYIFIFVSFRSEINTHNIIKKSIEMGKNIYVPVTDSLTKTMKASRLYDFNDLTKKYMGILEPKDDKLEIIDNSILDLSITPGLAFDKLGYRLGYGGGFYDKFFATLSKKTVKLGIGFNFQFVDSLPHDIYDLPLDYFISENIIKNFK